MINQKEYIMSKKKKWIKPRHKIIQAIAKVVLKPYCKWKYGITAEKFKEEEDRLQKEFSLISGIKDLAENSTLNLVENSLTTTTHQEFFRDLNPIARLECLPNSKMKQRLSSP